MVEQISMRDKAIALAKLGFRVFKLFPLSKRPAVEKFYDVASCDQEVVRKMWTAPDGSSTDHNIGISTDGMMVLDVDNKNGKNGDATLQRIVKEFGLSLDTLVVATPSGGRHYFYKLPPGVEVKNSVGKFGPGVDIRGHHGFVVAVGSIVPLGEYSVVLPAHGTMQ